MRRISISTAVKSNHCKKLYNSLIILNSPNLQFYNATFCPVTFLMSGFKINLFIFNTPGLQPLQLSDTICQYCVLN